MVGASPFLNAASGYNRERSKARANADVRKAVSMRPVRIWGECNSPRIFVAITSGNLENLQELAEDFAKEIVRDAAVDLLIKAELNRDVFKSSGYGWFRGQDPLPQGMKFLVECKGFLVYGDETDGEFCFVSLCGLQELADLYDVDVTLNV